MSVGNWNPNEKSGVVTINDTLINRFISLAAINETDKLAEQFSESELQRYAQLMTGDYQVQWQQAGQNLTNNQLWQLIQFLICAEQLPGWQAGALSPAIILAKLLKQRGEPLDKDKLLWIKQYSDNRYLPYGPLL